MPTFEQWCQSLGLRTQPINAAILSHYRSRINAQRGLA